MEPGTDFRINIYYFTLGVKLYIITYNTFLFSGYMSLAGDNPDLKKFIVSLRSRMLRYDLTCLCLYLAMSMAINGGIILSEQDLLDALIL